MSSRNFGFDSKVFNNGVLNNFKEDQTVDPETAKVKNGFFHRNYYNSSQTLLLKQYNPEINNLFVSLPKSSKTIINAYLEALLSNTEETRVDYYGQFQTFVKEEKNNKVHDCINKALYAFSFGILTFFSGRIKDIDGEGGINNAFREFENLYNSLDKTQQNQVKKAVRHQLYLQQFLNFYDRHDGNKLITSLQPLAITNIDLDPIPNDNHIVKQANKAKKYIDLLPIYKTNSNLYFDDKNINNLFIKNSYKGKKLFADAYDKLYQIMGINTDEYLDATKIRNFIKFDKNNIDIMIKKAVSIYPEITYEDFKKGLTILLSSKIRFQKQLIAEIISPETRHYSLIPFIKSKENNKNYNRSADVIKKVLEEDIKQTEDLIKNIENGESKQLRLKRNLEIEKAKLKTAEERLKKSKNGKISSLKTLENSNNIGKYN